MNFTILEGGGWRPFLRLYSLPPTMIMRIWALCCTISGWRNLLCCIPAALHFWRSATLKRSSIQTLRLSSATGGGLTQQLYMNGLHAMIAFLADIRMRTAYGVVRRKHPGEECHHKAEVPQKAFRQTFYSACNAYHQIIKRQKMPSAVSRLLQAHVCGVMPQLGIHVCFHMITLPRDC
jgi:hypothetical protein